MDPRGNGIVCVACGHHMPLRGSWSAGVTRTQYALLDVVMNKAARQERLPTYEALAADLGIKSKSTIARLLDELQRKGFITRVKRRRASIQPTDKATALYRPEAPHA